MTITLKTLPQATAQEVFDQVAGHLLRQMQQSVDKSKPERHCMYRYDGLMCAAGCLIAEDEYRPEMEDCRWDNLVDRKVVPSDHEVLIGKLQYLHDSTMPVFWRERLMKLAADENLEWRF